MKARTKSNTAKVAISLPEELLESIERERRVQGESRSQFFRRAAEALVRQRREQELDEQYIRGYLLFPETGEDEAQGLNLAGLAAFAEVPWEDDCEEGDSEE